MTMMDQLKEERQVQSQKTKVFRSTKQDIAIIPLPSQMSQTRLTKQDIATMTIKYSQTCMSLSSCINVLKIAAVRFSFLISFTDTDIYHINPHIFFLNPKIVEFLGFYYYFHF